jgi:hypothetical protein
VPSTGSEIRQHSSFVPIEKQVTFLMPRDSFKLMLASGHNRDYHFESVRISPRSLYTPRLVESLHASSL